MITAEMIFAAFKAETERPDRGDWNDYTDDQYKPIYVLDGGFDLNFVAAALRDAVKAHGGFKHRCPTCNHLEELTGGGWTPFKNVGMITTSEIDRHGVLTPTGNPLDRMDIDWKAEIAAFVAARVTGIPPESDYRDPPEEVK